MKKLTFAVVGAAALALAACGGQKEEAANAEENLATENLETMANEAADTESEALENQAAALENEGNAAEPATDEADNNAANVNAM